MVVRLHEARLAIPAGDAIGEAPVWDEAGQRLLWVDHLKGVIHEATGNSGRGWHERRRWSLNRPVAAAIPRIAGGLIVASGREILILTEEGTVRPFASLDVNPSVIRINEAKCDADGHLWVGTLSLEFRPDATLYRITPEGSVTRVLEGVSLANGFDWSPDHSTFYFIDSLRMSVDEFDFDVARGSLSDRRLRIAIEAGAGAPNGLTVDREGSLWVALTGGAEVRRFSARGELTDRVGISVPGATSCAFGGADCTDLFITSRSGRMPEIALSLGVRPEMMESSDPEAGALFVCQPPAQGKPAHRFAG